MSRTYRLKYTKRLFTNTNSKRWFIITLGFISAFVLGIAVGYLTFSIIREVDIAKKRERIVKLKESSEAYKEINSILLNAIDLNAEYQKAYFSSSPQRQDKISGLKSELRSLKDQFRSIEAQIAVLENRKQEDLNIDFVLPERSFSGDRIEEKKLGMVKDKVIDGDGSPLAGVEIKIQNSYEGVTNQEGEYVIEDAPKDQPSILASLENETPEKKRSVINDARNSVHEIVSPHLVKDMILCKGIEKRKSPDGGTEYIIIGADDEFEREVGRVVCYTEIKGARKNSAIEHRWFWEDQLLSRIRLEVKADSWRTYSSKQIMPEKVGTWRVEVTGADDNTVLASRTFTVR